MQIGKIVEIPCFLGGHVANRHVSLTGISGSGKTVRLNLIEMDAAKSGKTVIIFDINSSHSQDNIFPCIKDEYLNFVNRIDAKRDGINIRFLQPIQGKNGQTEDEVNVISATAYALGIPLKMGSRQMGVVREVELFAMRHAEDFPDEMSAIKEGLREMDNAVADTVYQKMWVLIHSNVFRKSEKQISSGKINIISFTDVDKITQAILVEIILSYFWRTFLIAGSEDEVVLVLDEYQNLMLGEGSCMRTILREGRKFGISLLLATQTLSVFDNATRAVINQAATCLYFRPEANDIKNVAKEIDPENMQRWMNVLKTLKRGEAVTVGEFDISDREVCHPVLTRW